MGWGEGFTPVNHPTQMSMLLTRSTGTKSATQNLLYRQTRNIPFPIFDEEGWRRWMGRGEEKGGRRGEERREEEGGGGQQMGERKREAVK